MSYLLFFLPDSGRPGRSLPRCNTLRWDNGHPESNNVQPDPVFRIAVSLSKFHFEVFIQWKLLCIVIVAVAFPTESLTRRNEDSKGQNQGERWDYRKLHIFKIILCMQWLRLIRSTVYAAQESLNAENICVDLFQGEGFDM